MPIYNNPAGRLHLLLMNLKNIPKTNPSIPSFAAVLNSPNDTVLLIQRIARIAALVERAKERVLATREGDTEIFLEWVHPIQVAFTSFSLSGQIGDFTDRYDAIVLERLRFCAHMLSQRSSDPELLAERIEKRSEGN
jgi:hypothetical protein